MKKSKASMTFEEFVESSAPRLPDFDELERIGKVKLDEDAREEIRDALFWYRIPFVDDASVADELWFPLVRQRERIMRLCRKLEVELEGPIKFDGFLARVVAFREWLSLDDPGWKRRPGSPGDRSFRCLLSHLRHIWEVCGGEGLKAYWKEHSDVPLEDQRRDDAPIDPKGEPGGPFLEFVMAILRAAGDERTPEAVLKAIRRTFGRSSRTGT